MGVNRRDVLKLGALGAVGAAGLTVPFGSSVATKSASRLSSNNMPKPFQAAFRHQPVLQPCHTSFDSERNRYTDYYSVVERAGTANIVPGLTSPVYGYFGYNHVGGWVGGVPGPRIDTVQGREVVLRVRNQLPAVNPLSGGEFRTSTHLHGSASLPQYDGYASDITLPGFYKDYRYPNIQGARTLWYHDHGVHFTAQNAYSGLAAQYHLHDDAERDLLPQGEFDVALTMSDAMFAANGSLAYDDNSQSGLWGDIILVNGVPWPNLKVKKAVYRFRLLDASISRSFRPTLSTGDPLILVATDGGLMPKSQSVTQYRHAGAERYEFLIDFRKYKTGQKIQLKNLSNPNNVDYDFTDRIMQFEVTDEVVNHRWSTIPDTLVPVPVMQLKDDRSLRTASLRLERKDSQWTINGKTWHDVEASGFKDVIANPRRDEVQVWTLENRSGGWFHPLHIHLIDFQVLDRSISGATPKPAYAWERGPKDVVYLGENETVRVIARFEHQSGYYMTHCHNLPHEDHDMMHQFSVGIDDPDAHDPNDPIHADPCSTDKFVTDDDPAYDLTWPQQSA